MSVLLIVIIVFALVFDFINGFHDAANSIATVVSTKVLTPFQAVMWAALFNFVAFFIFKDHGVANTVAKTVRPSSAPGVEMMYIVLAGLLAAIAWNLFTWWFGIPSSSSHTLIGGFAGAAIAHSGFSAIDLDQYPNIFHTVMFIFLAPLAGMLIAYIISLWFISSFNKTAGPKIFSALLLIGVWAFVYMMVHNRGIELFQAELAKSSVNLLHLPGKAALHQSVLSNEKLLMESRSFKWLLMGSIVSVMAIATLFMSRLGNSTASKVLKRLQLVSSAAFSIGHGGNDAQKVMGIITVALIAGGQIKDFKAMPTWVPLACYSAIALGTLSGGWKIIKTMGTRITKVTPFEGVAAETAGAITLFITENLKIPVSTTHTITGSIIGVGATKRLSAVRWGVTINLLWAWILTIPVSALMAAGIYWLIRLFV